MRPPPLQRLIRLAVSALLIGLVFWWVDTGEVVRLFTSANPLFLALGILVAAADRMIMILKWLPLVRVQGIRLPLGFAARVYLASSFASLFLPTSVGADMVRAVAIGRRSGQIPEAGASIVMERVLGLIGLAVVLAVSVPLALGESSLGSHALLAGAGIAAVVGLAALPLLNGVRGRMRLLLKIRRGRRLMTGVARLGDAYGAYRDHPGLLGGIAVASTIEQLVPVALYGLVALALEVQIGILPLIVGATLAQLLGRLPISVSGIGVEEGSAVVFLGMFGLEPSTALSLALGRRGLETAVFVPGAVFWKDLAGSEQLGDDPPAVGPGGRSVPTSGGAPTR